MILSILVNIKPSELNQVCFGVSKINVGLQDLLPGTYFNPKCSKFEHKTLEQLKHLKTPSTVLMDLYPHFSTNLTGSFWVLKLEPMSAVTVLCKLLSPSHVESGGCCGPAYMAGRVGLVAPGATEVDWAPHGKSQPWADKGFHMSGRVSLSRVPACFLLWKKAFQFTSQRCDGKAHKQHLRRVSVPNSEPKSTKPVLRLGSWEMIIAFWVVDI